MHIFESHNLKRTLISEERSFLVFLFLKFMKELETFIQEFQGGFDPGKGIEHGGMGNTSTEHGVNGERKKEVISKSHKNMEIKFQKVKLFPLSHTSFCIFVHVYFSFIHLQPLIHFTSTYICVLKSILF